MLYPADYEGDVTTLYNLTYNSSEYGGFAYGTGEEESPYEIANLEHLESLRTLISTNKGADTEGKYFELTRDLELGSTWVPLGNTDFEVTSPGSATVFSDDSDIFYGTFEGNGKTITLNDSTIVGASGDYALFSYVGAGSTIKNLNVNMNVTGYGTTTCGAVASYVFGNGADSILFENITVTGTITATGQAGGVVGWTAHGCTFKNCINYANITTNRNSFSCIGGISAQASSVGYNCTYVDSNGNTKTLSNDDRSVSFINCENYGTLTHACTGNSAYSIIGNMVGQVANNATSLNAIENGGDIGYSVLTFANCVCEGTIYGYGKESNKDYYQFEGFIYNAEENHTYTDADTTYYESTVNTNKLLIGGATPSIVYVNGVKYTTTDHALGHFGKNI